MTRRDKKNFGNKKDVILNSSEFDSVSYLSRKGQVYQELNTQASDWHPCEINLDATMIAGKETIYILPPNYKQVTTQYSNPGHCHLCGTSILRAHYIQNDITKMILLVGSECVYNHYGRAIKKKVREYADNKCREGVKDFLTEYIAWAKTQYEFEFPADTWQARRIKSDVYEDMKKAEKMLGDFGNTGIRKLRNFYTKHKDDTKIAPVEQKQSALVISNLKELVFCYDNKIERKITFGRYAGSWLSQVHPDYINWSRQKLKEKEESESHSHSTSEVRGETK